MASTYTPIATTTGTGSTKSITFSSIPSTYTDLRLVASYQMTSSIVDEVTVRFNSDSGSNYSYTQIRGDGSAAASTRASNQTYCQVGLVANNNTQNEIIDIQNYSNTTTYKTLLARHNNASIATYAYAGLWRSTSAITSVTFAYLGANATYFDTNSTFTLYGIKAA